MRLEQWVLFIDMLGYRDINGHINDDASAISFLDFMKRNETIFSDQDSEKVKADYSQEPFDLYKFYDIQITFISDSLIINYKPIEFLETEITEKIRLLHSANTLFIITNRLQNFIYHCLKEKNILVRGGVSNKYCLVQGNIAVGDGLIEAYLNESKRAIFPRIVISEDIINNLELIKSFEFICQAIYNVKTFLKDDGDGIFYIDYLKYNIKLVYTTMLGDLKALQSIDAFLNTHKNVIENKLIEIDNQIKNENITKKLVELEKVKSKIIWLKDYHNESIKEAIPKFLIEY